MTWLLVAAVAVLAAIALFGVALCMAAKRGDEAMDRIHEELRRGPK